MVESLHPFDSDVLYRLARTAGYLNRDAVSAGYYERILGIVPDHREAIGSLGWMYYKLHRLGEGEQLLRSALERFGPDPDFSMTLGTIYSDMFRYGDAKAHYLEAIAGGENIGDREFTAVAHYNLSILESRFYNYSESFDRTNASLASQNRASGRLARGELFLRRLELNRVFSEYQTAYEIDTSPLSKVNLAQAYQVAGRLEEAELYAKDCLNSGDLFWMLNYGINPDRFKRDLYEILHDTYSGLAKTEERVIYGNFKDAVRGFFRRWYYRYKAVSHRLLFQKYSLLAADAYSAYSEDSDSGVFRKATPQSNQGPDAWIQYYNAFESYPRRALPYLRNARNYEVPLIHPAETSYDVEEGALLKNRDLLLRSIPEFDPLWERDMIADTYAELSLLYKGKRQRFERYDAAERLYSLNRGNLRQKGIALPVNLDLNIAAGASGVETSGMDGVLRRTLKKMGLEALDQEAYPCRFRLSITVAGGEARCELYDGGRGTAVLRRSIPLVSVSAPDIAAFAKTLGDLVFIEEGRQ
jgi:hypothetical protein